MKIHSARGFRHWYKTEVKQYDDERHDDNFIGCTLRGNDGKILKSGFFEMYHGDKDEVDKFLPSILDIAEDDQAVYEFLQNAVDCGSTHFYAFYDDDYFLAINNGKQFEREGIKAILNIAQSDKHDEELIGRLGIGFKLVHRLVGKNDGSDELVHDLKGPSVFSWSSLSDLNLFIENDGLELVDDHSQNNGLPLLFKIICTNFPTSPGEMVIGLKGEDVIPFSTTEYQEMRSYVNKCLTSIDDLESFNSGTLFFIKLGEGKRDLLDRNHKDLQNGIQFSMNMLKQLSYVRINDSLIEKSSLKMESGKILKNDRSYSLIAAKTENDINFSVGYCDVDYNNDDSYVEVDKLRNSPNFYKYFPMGDECHKFALLLHSDSFNFESNRRKLHDDTTNRNLLREIALFLKDRLDEYRETGDKESFLKLYASILYCEQPHDNSKWLKEHFTDLLMDHLRQCLPTLDGYCSDASKVKVCQMRTSLNLVDVGLPDYHWFAFNTSKLIGRANSSSGLKTESWDIVYVIFHAKVEDLDKWISSRDEESYKSFISELDEALKDERKRGLISKKLQSISLLRFGDGSFYCYKYTIRYKSGTFLGRKEDLTYSANRMFRSSYLNPIEEDLETLGLNLSTISIDSLPNLAKVFPLPEIKAVHEWLFSKGFFYSSKLSKLGDNTYNCLQQSLLKLFHLHIPNVETRGLSHCWNHLFADDCKITNDFIYIKGDAATEDEIQALIDFCQVNEEEFFNSFVVFEEGKNSYALGRRSQSSNVQQFYAKGRLVSLVNDYFSNLHLLPKFLQTDKIKSLNGILSEDEVQKFVINHPSFNEIQHELAFAISSKFRSSFLERLQSLRIDLDSHLEKDCYEYRVLDMACKTYVHNSTENNKIGDFMDKVVVCYEGIDYELSTELLGERDYFEFVGHQYKVSEILPNCYSKGGIVDIVIDTFTELGLDRKELTQLLSVNEDVNVDDLYRTFRSQVKVLINSQQLGFAISYSQINNTNLEGFKVKTLDRQLHDLGVGYYYDCIVSFLPPSIVLAMDYKGLCKFVDLPSCNVLDGPYINEGKFCCPGFVKDDWDDDKSWELLDILFNKWTETCSSFNNVNLNTIFVSDNRFGSIDIKKLLGFYFTTAVYPDGYALESEMLPPYAVDWIQDKEDGLQFMKDLGVSVIGTPLLKLRQYLKGDSISFDKQVIYQCSDSQLFYTLDWFLKTSLRVLDNKMLRVIEEIVEKIKDYSDHFKLHENYDYFELDRSSFEWRDDTYKTWKQETGIIIRLYNGKMPKKRYLNHHPISNVLCNDDFCIIDRSIFINNSVDVIETLQTIALSNEFDLLDMDKISVFVNSELVLAKGKVRKLEIELDKANARIKELENELKKFTSLS